MTFIPPLITANPQTITGGTYPRIATLINSGKYRIVVTPTAASSTFTGGAFHVIFGQPQGGLAFVDQTLELDDQADVSSFSQALTWSAGQTLTFTIDMRAGTRSVTIAGATTGNGTFTFTSGNAIIVASTNLEIGNVGGSFTLAATIGSIDDTAPNQSWTPNVPAHQLRRAAPALALGLAAMVGPVLPIPQPPAPPLSWEPSFPDLAPGARQPLNVGGQSAPTMIVPPPVAPPLSWEPTFPDMAPGARQPLNAGGEFSPARGSPAAAPPLSWVGTFPDWIPHARDRNPVAEGGTSGPVLTIPTPPAPPLSWDPVFPDLAPGARYPLNVGGEFGPEAVIPQPPAPGMAWVSSFPDMAPRARAPLQAAAGLTAPPFAGGKSLTIGAMTVRQNILSALAFSTPLTTFGTDATFTADNTTDTCTATAHGCVNDAGPFTLSTTGTLPAGLDPVTKYYVGSTTANTFKLALSAALSDAGTFVNFTDNGTGTHTLVRTATIGTAPLYSTFVSIISRGNQSASPNLPTDVFGNIYAYVAGTPSLFAGFPQSAFSVAMIIGGKGGPLHTWSTSIGNIGGNQDEVLASGLEIFNARILQDSSNIEQPDGGLATITSNPVTTTARAILIAILGGNSNVNQENFWTFLDGFTKLPYISAEGDPSPSGYDQVCVAFKNVDIKGTYRFRAQGTVGPGGPSGAKMILLAFQAVSSDLSPFDWNFPQADMPRGPRRPIEAGETAPPRIIAPSVPPVSSWDPAFPDVLARAPRPQPSGETAPPSFGDAAKLLAWLPTVVDPPRRRWAPAGGETAPPPVLPAPLPWAPSFPDVVARAGTRIQSGETAPPLVSTAPAVPPPSSWGPTYPHALARSVDRIPAGETAPAVQPATPAPSIASWSPTFPHALARTIFRLQGGESAPVMLVPPPVVPSMASWVQQPVMPTLRARRAPPSEVFGPVLVIPQPPAPPLWAPVCPDIVWRARPRQQGGEVSPFTAAINFQPPLVRLDPQVTVTAEDPIISTVTSDDPIIVTVTS